MQSELRREILRFAQDDTRTEFLPSSIGPTGDGCLLIQRGTEFENTHADGFHRHSKGEN
jgi:hypothetical protein